MSGHRLEKQLKSVPSKRGGSLLTCDESEGVQRIHLSVFLIPKVEMNSVAIKKKRLCGDEF